MKVIKLNEDVNRNVFYISKANDPGQYLLSDFNIVLDNSNRSALKSMNDFINIEHVIQTSDIKVLQNEWIGLEPNFTINSRFAIEFNNISDAFYALRQMYDIYRIFITKYNFNNNDVKKVIEDEYSVVQLDPYSNTVINTYKADCSNGLYEPGAFARSKGFKKKGSSHEI